AKAAALLEAGATHVIATEEQDIVTEVARLTGGKGVAVVFDAVGGPAFEKLAEATATGGLLLAYGRFSPEVTPLPLAQLLWKDLTIRVPNAVVHDEKLAALKQFIGEGLAAGTLRPII